MAAGYKFDQPTSNIIVQFFSEFESAIHNHAPKWPDTTYGDMPPFKSLKLLIYLLPLDEMTF